MVVQTDPWDRATISLNTAISLPKEITLDTDPLQWESTFRQYFVNYTGAINKEIRFDWVLQRRGYIRDGVKLRWTRETEDELINPSFRSELPFEVPVNMIFSPVHANSFAQKYNVVWGTPVLGILRFLIAQGYMWDSQDSRFIQINQDIPYHGDPGTIAFYLAWPIAITLKELQTAMYNTFDNNAEQTVSDLVRSGLDYHISSFIVYVSEVSYLDDAGMRLLTTALGFPDQGSYTQRLTMIVTFLRSRITISGNIQEKYSGPVAEASILRDLHSHNAFYHSSAIFPKHVAKFVSDNPNYAGYFYYILDLLSQGSSPTINLVRLYINDTTYNQDLKTIFFLLTGQLVNVPVRQSLPEELSKYVSVLQKVYGTSKLDKIETMPEQPIEKILRQMVDKSVDKKTLLKTAGIHYQLVNKPETYLENNISDYIDILNRKETPPPFDIDHPSLTTDRSFEKFVMYVQTRADGELIRDLPMVLKYENRHQLLDLLFQATSDRGFLMILKPLPGANRNEYDTYYTNISEIPKPYVAYGSLRHHVFYTPEELVGAFNKETVNTGTPDEYSYVRFRKPEAPMTDIFSDRHVRHLRQMCTDMIDIYPQRSDEFNQLISQITLGLNLIKGFKVETLINAVKQSSSEVKALVQQMLYDVFYLGMYMRNWKGPGNPYPLKVTEVRGSNVDPMNNTQKYLELVFKHYEAIKLLDNRVFTQLAVIRTIEYNSSNEASYTGERLIPTLELVAKGEFCIKMASSVTAMTGYYYLSILFGIFVPNFKPRTVEYVD
jgi:hypothetical protein